jgi:hypothetical protein
MPCCNVIPIPQTAMSWEIRFDAAGIADLLAMAEAIAAAGYRTSINYFALGSSDGGPQPYISVGRLGGGAAQQGQSGDYVVLSGSVVTVCNPAVYQANWAPAESASPLPPADLSAVNQAVSGLQAMSS